MRPILMISAAASLLLAGQALAQTPAPAAEAPAASASASTTVSDAELKKFAGLAREIKAIMDRHQPTIAAAADPAAKSKAETAMSGELQVAVVDAGFTVQRYNEIATAMQKDTSLLTRMQQLASGGQPATSSTQ
jgi:hypothetical protein